ncbi:MAG TPA: hypothetical protein VER03_26030 [Bryobacteraceae bacterium]|nr:hypothetical protein [Bryobacteraceae bacterium]
MKLAVCILASLSAFAETLEHSGFVDVSAYVFPQLQIGDRSRIVGDALFRYEAIYNPGPWLRVETGFDVRTDTHRQTERSLRISWRDRGLQRPAVTARTLSGTFRSGPLTVQLGKQLIRWGAADTVKPVDRFAPRDFLNPVESEVLPVTAARASLEFRGGTRRIELVATPQMTPSRLPLARQRWMPIPPGLPEYPEIRQPRARYPQRAQFGALWSHTRNRLEYSACFFDGFNYNPSLDVITVSVSPLVVEAVFKYSKLRMFGGDVVWAGRPFTIRAEGGYFQSTQQGNVRGDNYAFYVVQLERQQGAWSGVLAYAGQNVTRNAGEYLFDPDRALAGAILARSSHRLTPQSELRVEGAMDRQGVAALTRVEYSRSMTANWRTTVAFTWIHGDSSHLLGQYARNGYGRLTNRYSF